tara:strand:+ start:14480 stop:14596 length:117 start_codon:yes stop_codon:yes gene_type:complete
MSGESGCALELKESAERAFPESVSLFEKLLTELLPWFN